MLRSMLWAIALVVGTTVPEASGTPEQTQGFSGSLAAGWNLVAIPYDRAELPRSWTALKIWPVSHHDEPMAALDLTHHGSRHLELRHGGYWVHTENAQPFWVRAAPQTHALPLSTSSSRWPFLGAKGNDGPVELGALRVVRWDPEAAAYVQADTNGRFQLGQGYFGYRRSVPSSRDGSRPRAVSQPVTVPGQFERPTTLAITDGSGLLVRTALSRTLDGMQAHVAYVVRPEGQSQGNEIYYHRSDTAGKPKSYSQPPPWPMLVPGSVRDLALAARGNRVSIGWIANGVSQTKETQVVVVESIDGGQSFGAKKVVRMNGAWKRGLDIAYDRSSNHHMVWGEANKAYYLKNLEGIPSNVFDNERRRLRREETKYLRKEVPNGHNPCACIDCWCEESYVLGADSTDAAHDSAPSGFHVYRLERHVLHPSLHIVNDQVSIVARQTRLWDPEPVIDPAWSARTTSPLYGEEKIGHEGLPIRRIEGWGTVWKKEYEPGDEALWKATGGRFQYRYSGSWQESDAIVLARRSISDQPAPELAADKTKMFVEPNPQDDTLSARTWEVSSVIAVGGRAHDNNPSYPELTNTPERLVLVYEDGSSTDPNQPGQNPIRIQSSADGGQSWSPAQTVGTGYMPTVGATRTGELRVLYYEPDPSLGGTIVAQSRGADQNIWGTPTRINSEKAKPIHWKSHGEASDGLEGGASLASADDLFFAAWIEQVQGRDHIVTSRASRRSEVVAYNVELPAYTTQGRATTVKLSAQNEYHMRVNHHETLYVDTMMPHPPIDFTSLSAMQDTGSGGPVESEENQTPVTTDGLREQHHRHSVPLKNGEAIFWANPAGLQISGSAGLVQLAATPLGKGVSLLQGASGAPKLQFDASADGNYEKAKRLRDELWRQGPLSSDGQPTGHQVEYQAVEGVARVEAPSWPPLEDEGQSQDSVFLAKHERVWAYTQGIALAQYARINSEDSDGRAQALARTLCIKAVRSFATNGQTPIILGWPFSWNTMEDTWKDARLVTGATAWVVHGLGLFLVSQAFQKLALQEQTALRACYQEALFGLELHRRPVVTEDGRRLTLMSAGWTTQGLVHARVPWKLTDAAGVPLAAEGEVWDYYDVLDAIGYEHFDQEAAILITRKPASSASGPTHLSEMAPKKLAEHEFHLLKQQVQADNIVTEHNLDVLSVLNHALKHASSLGLNDAAGLRTWRDDLQRGIFEILFDRDETRWRRELENALDRNQANPAKQAHIRAALAAGDWGRVVTGGTLQPRMGEQTEVFEFIPNRDNTAIDNCSWLSLSVDPVALNRSEDIDALARCLEFTTLAFGKDIAFRGKTYYGAHYFFDGFEDPYIQATDRQEQSYHLEATTGLVMGLLTFARHYPTHPKSGYFRQEAFTLWDGIQAFVIDHDFPYSSQRIVNLSTLLISSTALIWFIDTYDQISGGEVDDSGIDAFLASLEIGQENVDVSADAAAGALFELNQLMLSQKVPNSVEGALHGLSLRLILARGKLLSKFGDRLAHSMDDLLQLSPEWLIASTVGIHSAAYLGAGGQIDVGLETILVGPNSPSTEFWEPKGVVLSEAVVAQPMGSHFRSENEIRGNVPIYPTGPVLQDPRANPPLSFNKDRIYFIDMDWLGHETSVGKLGVLRPGQHIFWPVFALKTDRPKAAILEAFIRDHKLFKELAPHAEHLPDPLRGAWLYLLELAIRSDFGRTDAERYGIRSFNTGDVPYQSRTTNPPEAEGLSVGPSAPPTGRMLTPEEAKVERAYLAYRKLIKRGTPAAGVRAQVVHNSSGIALSSIPDMPMAIEAQGLWRSEGLPQWSKRTLETSSKHGKVEHAYQETLEYWTLGSDYSTGIASSLRWIVLYEDGAQIEILWEEPRPFGPGFDIEWSESEALWAPSVGAGFSDEELLQNLHQLPWELRRSYGTSRTIDEKRRVDEAGERVSYPAYQKIRENAGLPAQGSIPVTIVRNDTDLDLQSVPDMPIGLGQQAWAISLPSWSKVHLEHLTEKHGPATAHHKLKRFWHDPLTPEWVGSLLWVLTFSWKVEYQDGTTIELEWDDPATGLQAGRYAERWWTAPSPDGFEGQEPQKAIHVPFTRSLRGKHGHILVTAVVKGTKLRLVLDTGAAHSALSDKALARIDPEAVESLDQFSINVSTQRAGPRVHKNVRIRQLRLGMGFFGRGGHDFDVEMAVNKSISSDGDPIDGLLGADLLHRYVVEIDLVKNQLRLWPPSAIKENALDVRGFEREPFELLHGLINVSADLEGVPVGIQGSIDTGAPFSSVNTITGGLGQPEEIEMVKDWAGVSRPLHRYASLRIGNIRLPEFKAVVQNLEPVERQKHENPHRMLIGLNAFRDAILILDYPHRELYFRRVK